MNTQESIRRSILKFYKERDVQQTKSFCRKLLEAQDHKSDKKFKSEVHGEICEALLEVLLLDYINRNNLQNRWFIEKGMVLKDLNSNNKNFYTELDLTLFTPGKIVLFECKSYAGDKKICDECTIVRTCGEFDVYKQNLNHMKVLNSNIKTCFNGKSNAYKMVLFNFSLGTIKDLREEQWKKRMPIIDIDNLDDFLNVVAKQPSVWDVHKLKKICNIIMEKNSILRKKHLAYVKTLHH